MPAQEKFLDPATGPLAAFACELRKLRTTAGFTYRQLAAKTHYSHVVFVRATGGRELPSWPVVKQFVIACGATPDLTWWEQRWSDTKCVLKASDDDSRGRSPPDLAESEGGVRSLTDVQVSTLADYVHALQRLKASVGGLSYRGMAQIAGRQLGINAVSASTLADLCKPSRRRLSWDKVRVFLMACGLSLDGPEMQAWNRALIHAAANTEQLALTTVEQVQTSVLERAKNSTDHTVGRPLSEQAQGSLPALTELWAADTLRGGPPPASGACLPPSQESVDANQAASGPRGEGPWPSNGARQTVLEPFAKRLCEVRLAAGMPSYATLNKVDGDLRSSTISDVLSGRTAPTLDFVLSFVRACWTIAERLGRPVDSELFDENVWRNDWFQLQRDLGEYRRRKGKSSEPPDAGHTGDGRSQSARQLPPDVSVFVGRSNQLGVLDKLLEQHAANALASPTVVIEGMPGVGKTTLAVHWAHRVQWRFDGGLLFIDLRGFGPEAPMTTEQALAALLTALGAPSGDTSDLPGLLAQYRAATADRRILLILDNVASFNQVRALLPATAGSMVLMTSRHNMSGSAFHAGIHRMTLQPMSEAESRELLARLIGSDGQHTDEELDKIADLGARLPLALSFFAERSTHLQHLARETVGDELRHRPLTTDADVEISCNQRSNCAS